MLATYEESTEVHIVTDLCDAPLLAYLEEANPSKQLDEGLLRQVVGQVLAGVATMHNLGIVHRDLKPDNLMVNRPQRSGAPCQVQKPRASAPPGGSTLDAGRADAKARRNAAAK